MKKIVHLTLLLLPLAAAQPVGAQLTKLSNNTSLDGLVVNNDKVILVSDVDQSLWTTNATANGTMKYTTKVTQEKDGGGGILGGKIYFSGVDATHGAELWVTDGTDAGTSMVKDINAGAPGSSPDNFFNFNNQLFFFAKTAAEGMELWKTDGTPAGTVMVKDINPGAGNGLEGTTLYFFNNNLAYFAANDGTHGNEIWRTDGTTGGTQLVKDINPGTGDGVGFRVLDTYVGIFEFLNLGGITLFPANDGSGTELWKTNGTAAGTTVVKDINQDAEKLGSIPNNLIKFNNKVYFSARTNAGGSELYVTDGTAAGTSLVKDIYPGEESSSPSLITGVIFGNRLVFTATDADHGTELWSTDGTEGGTQLLKDILPGTESSNAGVFLDYRSVDLNFAGYHTPPFNGKAFVQATTKDEGMELWITDGTAAGTVLVKDIYPGAESGLGNINYFYTNNGLFFRATGSDEQGDELWKSDGTADGTMLVKDINPTGSSDLEFRFVYNNHLYITADDGDNNEKLSDLYLIDESITLPITLFNFGVTVQPSKAVKLSWNTANEINSSHFDIERSSDGVHFSNIDKVNAAGNSGTQQHYQYTDIEPSHLSNRVLYYRLKMVDKDASFKYSQILTVHFKEGSFRFTLSPNPVQGQLNVVVATGASKSVALRITDPAGKQVYGITLPSSQNITQQNINVAGWQPGVYYIQLITDNGIKSQKFVKQ